MYYVWKQSEVIYWVCDFTWNHPKPGKEQLAKIHQAHFYQRLFAFFILNNMIRKHHLNFKAHRQKYTKWYDISTIGISLPVVLLLGTHRCLLNKPLIHLISAKKNYLDYFFVSINYLFILMSFINEFEWQVF